jgi:hypothetical protein
MLVPGMTNLREEDTMADEDIDYIEVAFETDEDLQKAKTALAFAAETSRPSGLLDPDQWGADSVEAALKPLGIKFEVLEEGFKWDEHGVDDQWDGPSM